jgi:raffinose/stachyose/melibiose transport system substrate-binding protein
MNSYNGTPYGVPNGLVSYTTFYNPAIFAKYGLSVPKTWAQFIAICDTLKAHGITPLATMGLGANGEAAQVWASEVVSATFLGPDYVNAVVKKTADFSDPRWLSFLTHLKQLAAYYAPNWKGVGATGDEQRQAFVNGTAAMYVGHADDAPDLLRANPNVKLASFPAPPASASGTAYSAWGLNGSWMISKSSRVMTAGKALLKYLASTAGQQLYNDTRGVLPVKSGVKPPNIPLYATMAQRISTAGVPNVLIGGICSPLNQIPATTGQVSSNAETAQSVSFQYITAMMDGQMSPEQVAKEYQSKLAWYFKDPAKWDLHLSPE